MSQKAPIRATLLLAMLTTSFSVGCTRQVTTSAEDRSALSRQPAVRMGELKTQNLAPEAAGSANTSTEVRVGEMGIATASASSSAAAQEAAGGPSLELGDVFFDYDKFTLRKDAETVLNADARVLTAKTGMLTIAGHCDERGTGAYNLVLGEKRARSVKRYLEDLGVPASRLRVISYGKEKPFCQDHNPQCWQSNRRAHFSLP